MASHKFSSPYGEHGPEEYQKLRPETRERLESAILSDYFDHGIEKTVISLKYGHITNNSVDSYLYSYQDSNPVIYHIRAQNRKKSQTYSQLVRIALRLLMTDVSPVECAGYFDISMETWSQWLVVEDHLGARIDSPGHKEMVKMGAVEWAELVERVDSLADLEIWEIAIQLDRSSDLVEYIDEYELTEPTGYQGVDW